MNAHAIAASATAGYELFFQSIFSEGRAYAFPCDVAGRVDIDALSDAARNNYLYARAVIGREFFFPAVTSPPGRVGAALADVPTYPSLAL